MPVLRSLFLYVVTITLLTNKDGLLIKLEVKIAGYWPSSLIFNLYTEANFRAENAFAALIMIGCTDVRQLRSANEILRIPFQCENLREIFALLFSQCLLLLSNNSPYHSFMLHLCKAFFFLLNEFVQFGLVY